MYVYVCVKYILVPKVLANSAHLCIFIYMYMYIYICVCTLYSCVLNIRVYTYLCQKYGRTQVSHKLGTGAHMNIFVCIHIYVCMNTFVCAYVYTYV